MLKPERLAFLLLIVKPAIVLSNKMIAYLLKLTNTFNIVFHYDFVHCKID